MKRPDRHGDAASEARGSSDPSRTVERQEGRSASRDAAAPSEGKALKGSELHERSGTKQGREPVEEQAVRRA
jgi:hypothetical protein